MQVELPCPIGVAAVSGCLPQSASIDAFADDAPSSVPLGRWNVDQFAEVSPNAMESRFGSFVSGAEQFDAALFNISRYAVL